MRVLKAYADAGANGNYGFSRSVSGFGGRATPTERLKTGDSISLSEEAQQMLKNRDNGALSNCPQDATYDQYGNVTREFNSLQNDLRRLATQFVSRPDGAGLLGKLNSVGYQLAALEAQV